MVVQVEESLSKFWKLAKYLKILVSYLDNPSEDAISDGLKVRKLGSNMK